ncbi:Hepatocyte growth factor-regulated tyrosine kinase [Actinidia chinensis var. chinensis]|uniref:Hepatocyte growth factor-regulated tyrosine kinase n=1 Tax=Actinidia chinensis var. chinensis TaxID=1590841 RepID=A0A2R6PAR9_ACTCC|nr:Hepatocyte growth factor-regulated tyrosine kinase [Actinidia chinensis var. chinensis]
MAAELVNSATSEKLTEMDWTKNIQICELVARDQRQAKDVIKAIKKRLSSKNSNIQLFAVSLLEMLMNNIGDHVHRQVIDTGLLPILVKIVKKKSDSPVREKIFLLLDATQTSLGGASGKFPQYYSAYYDLVNAGVQFPQRPRAIPSSPPTSTASNNNVPGGEPSPSRPERPSDREEPRAVPESRDEKMVSRAIDLNEQLEKLLARHDALVSGRLTFSSNNLVQEEPEEEEAEQLFRRMRKGKACALPEDEERPIERPLGVLESPNSGDRMHRPLIRPLSVEPSQETNALRPAVSLPPPPAKHMEREKFFQENKLDGSSLSGHVRGLSLHIRNGSGSYSGSMDSD